MAGEDASSEDPRAFTNAVWWKRLLILCAGSFMNFLLGLVIVLILYSGAYAFRSAEIIDFMEGCPYQSEEGLHVGDRFYKIDGQRIYQHLDVSDFLNQGVGTYDLVMIRDGKKIELKDFPMEPLLYEGQSQKMFGFYFGYELATPAVTLRNTWDTTMEFARWVRMGLRELIHGRVSVDEMAGPVGIVDMMAETGAQQETTADALWMIFSFGAFIAVNLAVMNMLPIPALDGGRIFLLLVTWVIERITRKKLNPKYEGYIHGAGMILLLALMAFVMLNDILRIVKG
jgi:regulator of sigma E protease